MSYTSIGESVIAEDRRLQFLFGTIILIGEDCINEYMLSIFVKVMTTDMINLVRTLSELIQLKKLN